MLKLPIHAAQFGDQAFWYCVDFMVNLANLTNTSYHETNTWVLLLFLPGLLSLLIGVRTAQWFTLRRLRQKLGKCK